MVVTDIVFHCLIEECTFKTKIVLEFLDHLSHNHSQEKWSGFCNACAVRICDNKASLLSEIEHFYVTHINQMKLLAADNLPILRSTLIEARKRLGHESTALSSTELEITSITPTQSNTSTPKRIEVSNLKNNAQQPQIDEFFHCFIKV